jgi:ABC-2 type transport system ATP-binding protein
LLRASKKAVRVRSPQAAALGELVAGPDVSLEAIEPGLLEITGLTAEQIGEAAAANAIVLHELTPQQATLEEAFMELTQDAVEFHAGPPPAAPATAAAPA